MGTATKHEVTAADFNPFRELTTTFEQLKPSGADVAAFVDARRKDVEALVAANTLAYEALQALARTQSDLLTQAMQGMQESTQGLVTGGGGGVQHAEAARQAWQKMLTDMKDLAEQVRKAQAGAVAGLAERATQNLQAMQNLTPVK